MKIALSIIGVVMVFVGLIWFFQGIGVIKGSGMSSNVLWAIVGPIVILVGAAVFWYGNRRRSV